MATELLQPGVTVIQEFRSISPTIITPTLVPCVIAPAFQVLEALDTDATGNQVINTDAVASVPAILTTANPAPFTSLDGLTLVVSVNNGAPQTFTFSDPTALNLDAGQVKDQIHASNPAPAGFGAFVVELAGAKYVQLRTTATGDGQELQILKGTANASLGFNDLQRAAGVSNYQQDKVHVEQVNFPDPRGIIEELDPDEASIRVFVNTGAALQEVTRDSAFLRKKKEAVYSSTADITFPTTALTTKKFAFQDGVGAATQEYTFAGEAADAVTLAGLMNALIGSTKVVANGNKIDFVTDSGFFKAIAPTTLSAHGILNWDDLVNTSAWTLEAVDDGDGDTRTPVVELPRDNFTTPEGSASLVGTSVITAVNVHNLTLEAQLDGGSTQEITFDGGPLVGAAVFGAGNTLDTETLSLNVNGSLVPVTFSATDPIAITDAINQINAAAGVTVAYESDAAGAASVGGGYLALQVGGPTPIPGGVIKMVYQGVGDDNTWTDLGFAAAIGGDVEQTNTLAELISQIDATLGTGFSTDDGSGRLKLSSSDIGDESKVEVGNGTANALLGLTDGQLATGAPFPPKVGDSVWADGAFIGSIAVVTPGGVANRLKLDREVSTSFGASAVFIQAENIAIPVPADRPTPNLVIDSAGAVNVKHDFLRDTEGDPLSAVGALIVAYNALRLDVTQAAAEPALINLEDVIVLEEALSPINTDNPLSLMLYFALINAPGVLVTGMGVDATNSTNPDGTPEGYARALSFLESEEVYSLAPASQDPTVHQIFATHVNSQSDPDAKGERIVFINPEMPGEALAELIVSGTDGDSTAVSNEFDTKLASLASDVLASGVSPVGTIDVSEGLFLDITADGLKYNVSSISGTKINIRTAFAPGENDDGFYASSNLPATLISETFSVNKRGAALLDLLGNPDYDGIAQAYQDLGNAYGNRRVIMVAPELVGANIDGLEQKIKGYYLCAAIAGMVGQLPPQQGFSNFPITGFTRAFGSNDVLNNRQMNVGAAGGTYWVTQEVDGGPLLCRHQLTTDLSSIETRELSITKVVDFTAKFMRSGLRNFIGKFNITQPFLDTLSTVVQGQLSFLTESGVLIGGDLNNVIQDEAAPDTVLIDVTLDVPYPANYIRLTLVI